MQRGTFQLMKSVNRSIILNKIRTSEPISRAQISKETKLTPPTVSSMVRELIEQDLVMESDLGASKGGRKPTMLMVNKNGYYVIGVDAGPATMECVLSNLSGEIIERVLAPIVLPLTNDIFLDLLKETIHQVYQKVQNKGKILGIGVAMHGVIDMQAKTSLIAPLLNLKNIPLKVSLEEEFDVMVQIENDARAMALGESWFGKHGDFMSMMAVNIGYGVGAGIVINGKLYHGATGLASEVGHMTIDMHGEQCECGNQGCLEAYVSAPSMVKRANRLMPDKAITTSEDIYHFAVDGDQACRQFLQETGDIIGIGLMSVIHVMNPAMIILGGGVSKSEPFILPSIQAKIREKGLTDEAKNTAISMSKLGDDATILGAVALLLREVFEVA